MKTILYSFLTLFFVNAMVAQKTSNVVIFAEDATPFYAIVNGIKQNLEPQTNVKITGLTNPANQIKVIFKDASIPTLDKQIYFQEMNVEATMKIANTKKGYKLRYFGEVSMGAAVEDPAQNIITYQTVEPTAPAVQTPVTTTTTVVEETVVTNNTNVSTTTNPVKGEGINMNVNVGGVGFNVDINDANMVHENTNVNVGDVNSTMTTTTTTTTTSSVGNVGTDVAVTETAPVVYVQGYNGNYGCSVPTQSMNNIKQAINDEAFSDDKMMVAKQATKNKCLTTAQVKEIANLFDFEDDKLDYAKFAYDYTYDIDNYYQINSIFDFSDSKSELNNHISNR